MTSFDSAKTWERVWTREAWKRFGIDQEVGHWRVAGRKKARPFGEDLVFWKQYGFDLFAKYTEWRAKNPHMEIVDLGTDGPGIEVDLNEQLDFSLLPFKGFVDRVFFDSDIGELVVVDLKTGTRKPASHVQLGFYRAGLVARYGLDLRFGSYYMARTAELTPYMDLTIWTPDLVGRLLEQFRKAVNEGIFIPHINPLCPTCEVRRGCYVQGGDLAKTYDSLHPDYGGT
jgi:putative RecB family exonuclease